MSIFSRLSIPSKGFDLILRNTLTFVMANAEIVLGLGITLFSRLLILPLRGMVILFNTFPAHKPEPEGVLRRSVPSESGFYVPIRRLLMILLDASSRVI